VILGEPPAAAAAPAPAVSSFAGLTIERYALGGTLPDETSPLVPALYAKRDQWRRMLGPQVDRYNQALAPFGYHLTVVDDRNWGHPVYTLSHDGKVLYEILHGLGTLSVNARGDDFILPVETDRGSALVRPGRPAEAWDLVEHEFTAPVFVENDRVAVVRDAAETNTFPGVTAFSVWRGDTKAYSVQLNRDQIDTPVKGLWAWQNHWVLEVAGDVIIDGKSLKAEQGYSEVFDWHVVAGKPFYFATKGQTTSAVYDGRPAPDQYDEVPHYRCCSPGMYNAGGNDFMVWFYGKQDGAWSYVEVGRYDTGN
jgi:hypothetical protein